MDTPSRHKDLLQWLTALLGSGLRICEAVSTYLEATFGTADLASVLAGEDSSEIDSLLELIFFPDMETQLRYEARWGDVPFSGNDQDEVIRLLGTATIAVPLTGHRAGGHTPVVIAPDFVLEAFVRRLNICWQPDQRLVQILNDCHPRDNRNRMRVHLRNARLEWRPEQVALICQFLSEMPRGSPDLETLLCFLITLLPDLAAGMDFFDFLVAKKFFCFQALCKAEDFERRRQSSNMETMMLQGTRSAHGSIEQWRQQMRQIDRMCQSLFGRTHFFQDPAGQYVNLGNENNRKTVQAIMRVLS